MITILRSLGFQIGAVVAAIAAAATWLKIHDSKVAKRTETAIVERSAKKGAQANAKAANVYNSARKPGAADRLRADPKSCPDCR